jgi:hypothetical protein
MTDTCPLGAASFATIRPLQQVATGTITVSQQAGR